MDYEEKLEAFYSEVVREADICIDVGAHLGRHAIPLARLVGDQGRVYAFEPLPRQNAQLAASIAGLGLEAVVPLYNVALSDEEGTARFVVAEDAPAYSGLRERRYDTPTALSEIQVEVCLLDRLLGESLGKLRYVKIDTEGAEWAVIKGAAKTIERLRPIVSFEFGESSYAAYGVDPVAVHQFFEDLDYCVFDINGLRMSNGGEFARSSVTQAVWDYVALPREHEGLAAGLASRA